MKNYKKYIKNALFLMFLTAFTAVSAAQNVSEKELVRFPDGVVPNAYYVKYDKKTGAYAYEKVDTTFIGATLVTPKGESAKYNGLNVNNAYFDNSGNVYCAAYNFIISDSVSTYYLLKNGEQILTCDGLTDNWTEQNGTLYFKMRENKKEYFAMLNLASGNITKGKGYDTIFYMYWKPEVTGIEDDPPPYPGFTPGGKYYYGAILDGKRFVVIDGVEQKTYSDIDPYNTAFDKNGTFVYVATDEGSLNDYDHPVKQFVVQGDKEYGKFSAIYGPFVFDNSSAPYYIGSQNISASVTAMQVVCGPGAVSKSYSGGVSDIQFTPSGKTAFIGSDYLPSGNTESFIVVNGKESPKYDNVFNLSFDGETPVFIETKGDKQFVVKGEKSISDPFSSILYYRLFKDGTLYYVGSNPGNNTPDETDKVYVFIGDKKNGPFVTISGGDETADPPIKTDSTGAYIFYGSVLKNKKTSEYKQYVYWSKGKSGEMDEVDYTGLCNGKTVFIGYHYGDKDQVSLKGHLYIDGKEAGPYYENVSGFRIDEKSNLIDFIGVRNGAAYYVEAKL